MKSVRVALARDVTEGVHLVQPAGRGVDHFRALLLAFGPVSGPVLESLRLVGLRELNSEAENLVLRNGSLSGEEATIDRLPADPFERGLEIWRALALWSRVAEDLAALVRAVQRWRSAGYPQYVDCHVGRDYLQWVPSIGDGILEAFQSMSSPAAARDVLLLPRPDAIVQIAGSRTAALIEAVCGRTAADMSAWFREMTSLLTDEAQRTFARWKHRVAATSPGLVPLWIQRTDAERIDAAEAGFREGFSIIDWPLRKTAVPQLIVWTAEPLDFGSYLQATLHGIEMLGTLVEGLLRFANADLPVVPWRSWSAPSADEARALVKLGRSHYRTTALHTLRTAGVDAGS
jgi:hypothetical protein